MPVLTKIKSSNISDVAITSDKIADNAVTNPKVADDAISITELATDTGITSNYHKVPAFADDAARNTAISSPTVGMLIYNTGKGVVQQYNASGWSSVDSPPIVSSITYPGDDTALISTGDAGAGTQTIIITGSNFKTGVTVLIDGTAPGTVTKDSSVQITCGNCPAKTAGTKALGVVVTNTNGLSASIDIDYSGLPAWTTSSGNILTSFDGAQISTIDLAATSATSYAITTGLLPDDLVMSSSTGDITGTLDASAATYNITVTATDAELQSSARAFNLIVAAFPTGGDTGGLGSPVAGAYSQYTIGSSTYRVHRFIANGDFIVSTPLDCDILVVGGGGGSGSQHGGGGGAGALVWAPSYNSGVLATGTYNIVVGGGGDCGAGTPSSASQSKGSDGTDSTIAPDGGAVIDALTADGGGAGGGYSTSEGNTGQGNVGGSGGGAGLGGTGSPNTRAAGSGDLGGGAAPIYIFGGDGGSGPLSGSNTGGGGGGAAANGADYHGAGGIGEHDFLGAEDSATAAVATANLLYYARIGTKDDNTFMPASGGPFATSYIAGGGGGGAWTGSYPGSVKAGGKGGGGDGGVNGVGNQVPIGNPGINYTGGGGGGKNLAGGTTTDAKGGTGVVVIRYKI